MKNENVSRFMALLHAAPFSVVVVDSQQWLCSITGCYGQFRVRAGLSSAVLIQGTRNVSKHMKWTPPCLAFGFTQNYCRCLLTYSRQTILTGVPSHPHGMVSIETHPYALPFPIILSVMPYESPLASSPFPVVLLNQDEVFYWFDLPLGFVSSYRVLLAGVIFWPAAFGSWRDHQWCVRFHNTLGALSCVLAFWREAAFKIHI